MELADWLSLIAIIISIITLWRNKKIQEKLNEYEFTNELYRENILNTLPKLRNQLRNTDINGVTGVNELDDEIKKLAENILYFKYTHKDIYKKLRTELMNFDDFLVNSNKQMDGEMFGEFQEEINKYLEKIYKILVIDLRNDDPSFKIN